MFQKCPGGQEIPPEQNSHQTGIGGEAAAPEGGKGRDLWGDGGRQERPTPGPSPALPGACPWPTQGDVLGLDPISTLRPHPSTERVKGAHQGQWRREVDSQQWRKESSLGSCPGSRTYQPSDLGQVLSCFLLCKMQMPPAT